MGQLKKITIATTSEIEKRFLCETSKTWFYKRERVPGPSVTGLPFQTTPTSFFMRGHDRWRKEESRPCWIFLASDCWRRVSDVIPEAKKSEKGGELSIKKKLPMLAQGTIKPENERNYHHSNAKLKLKNRF